MGSSLSSDENSEHFLPPIKKSKIERKPNSSPCISMPNLQYSCLTSIMEYIEANKRIAISLFCPSLRSIENSVPLHMEKLACIETFFEVNEREFMWRKLTDEEALEMYFKNRTSPIYVHHLCCVLNRKLNLRLKFWPTKFNSREKENGDVIFGDNSELFCTENLKELGMSIERRTEDFLNHPIINQLSTLSLTADGPIVKKIIDRFSNLPVPNLSVNVRKNTPNKTSPLEYWIRQKIPNKKFIFRTYSYPGEIMSELKTLFDLKKGIFENQKCWVVRNDDDKSDSEVMLTKVEKRLLDDTVDCIISVQTMPKGSVKV